MNTVKAAKRRTQKQSTPQQEPLDPERQKEFESLSLSLTLFGFSAPVPLIERWSVEARANVITCVERWQNEFNRTRAGEAILVADRTPIPSLLTSIEALDAVDARKAVYVAQQDKQGGLTLDHNPYPPESAIGKIWVEAFGATETPAAKPDEVVTAEPCAPVVANQSELDKYRAEKASKETDRKADLEHQQQLAIEAAQDEMEEAVAHQAELEEQLVDMKAEMKELKAAFDNAGSRARKAAKTLRRARDGIFERTLPFPRDSKKSSLEVPDVNVGSDGVAKEVEPPKPAVDEGGCVSLDHLVKGDLQEFIPGTPEDKGISQKQADNLKELVGGETIGDLEKWIKSKGDWWLKELKESGKGFGKETVTKVQDAHEIIRRKFQIPSADEPAKVTEQPAVTEVMTVEEAIETLETIVRQCGDVLDRSTNDDGVNFARDVQRKARSVLETIDKTDQVTPDQTSAIRNWDKGVYQWWARLDSEDEFDDEDLLDVPDEDGDE